MNLFKRLVKEDPIYIESYEIIDNGNSVSGSKEIVISGIYTSFFDFSALRSVIMSGCDSEQRILR